VIDRGERVVDRVSVAPTSFILALPIRESSDSQISSTQACLDSSCPHIFAAPRGPLQCPFLLLVQPPL
jgi:hypothetical protein